MRMRCAAVLHRPPERQSLVNVHTTISRSYTKVYIVLNMDIFNVTKTHRFDKKTFISRVMCVLIWMDVFDIFWTVERKHLPFPL